MKNENVGMKTRFEKKVHVELRWDDANVLAEIVSDILSDLLEDENDAPRGTPDKRIAILERVRTAIACSEPVTKKRKG